MIVLAMFAMLASTLVSADHDYSLRTRPILDKLPIDQNMLDEQAAKVLEARAATEQRIQEMQEQHRQTMEIKEPERRGIAKQLKEEKIRQLQAASDELRAHGRTGNF